MTSSMIMIIPHTLVKSRLRAESSVLPLSGDGRFSGSFSGSVSASSVSSSTLSESVGDLNPGAPVFKIAATKREGTDAWCEWLAAQVDAK